MGVVKSGEAALALQVFGPLLGMDCTFTADQLAAVLVASPGDEGLLSDVHMVRFPSPPPPATRCAPLSPPSPHLPHGRSPGRRLLCKLARDSQAIACLPARKRGRF